MPESHPPQFGAIGWMDLTVPDAVRVRDFYGAVVGWKHEDVNMGGYNDFNMIPPGGEKPVAGICHARGPNADLPTQWLLYITVSDLDASLAQVRAHGGKQRTAVRDMGPWGRMCVIEDPAGAVAMLIQPPTT
jgi:predicted enzyme related to lactoylglutathione lyase